MHSILSAEIPIYMVLDTNWFIYLSKGEHPRVLQAIKQKVEEGKYVLLVHEIIESEYFENEDKPIRELEKVIEEEYNSVKALTEHMDSDDKENMLNLLNKYADSSKKRLELARQRLEIIKELISTHAIIIHTTASAKELAVTHALLKMAPMHKKNSFADALIFFSAYDYLRSKSIPSVNNSIFISNNSQDFSDPNDANIIHSDLKGYIDKVGMSFERNIAKAFKLSESLEIQIEKIVNEEWEDFFAEEKRKEAALGPDGFGII